MSDVKLTIVQHTDNYGKFEVFPLEAGWAHTYGNSIRRVLLTRIPGCAVSKVRIKGVDHEFSTLDGMKEDVLRLILNLQKVVFSIDGADTEKVVLKVKGKKEVKASDIKAPGNVHIANPDEVLAELTDDASLELEAYIETGYGFQLADDEIRNEEPGVIPLNKNFSPILKVNYNVEATRVGQHTDYEKLVLEIWTNGGVSPYEALAESVRQLLEGFRQINDVVGSVSP